VKSQQHLTPGPHNPLETKSALVCLTRKGTVRLLWQARSNTWSDVSVELGDAASAVEYSFTHAAFAPDNGMPAFLLMFLSDANVGQIILCCLLRIRFGELLDCTV
jgi:hypothetical protein